MVDLTKDELERRQREGFNEIIGAGAASLAEGEYWVIECEGEPLIQTASINLTIPVLVVCKALEADWDDLTDAGFRLAKGFFAYEQTADFALKQTAASNG